MTDQNRLIFSAWRRHRDATIAAGKSALTLRNPLYVPTEAQRALDALVARRKGSR